MSITEFLLARIAEDEYDAKAFINDLGQAKHWRADDVGGRVRQVESPVFGLDDLIATTNTRMEAAHIARHDPARVLRECAAKRRMVDFIFREAVSVDGEWGDSHDAAEIRAGKCSDQGGKMAEQGLAILAAAYADHPDYLPEWRA